MSLSLRILTSNYYKMRNNSMNLEQYNKLLKLYNDIKTNEDKYINMTEWYNLYTYSKNILPENPPNKGIILKMITDTLNINYIDLITDFYKLLDKTTDIKNISVNTLDKFKFIIFIISKQNNVSFKIDTNTWNIIRGKCLIGRNKTKMLREPILLKDIISHINSIITLN